MKKENNAKSEAAKIFKKLDKKIKKSCQKQAVENLEEAFEGHYDGKKIVMLFDFGIEQGKGK